MQNWISCLEISIPNAKIKTKIHHAVQNEQAFIMEKYPKEVPCLTCVTSNYFSP